MQVLTRRDQLSMKENKEKQKLAEKEKKEKQKLAQKEEKEKQKLAQKEEKEKRKLADKEAKALAKQKAKEEKKATAKAKGKAKAAAAKPETTDESEEEVEKNVGGRKPTKLQKPTEEAAEKEEDEEPRGKKPKVMAEKKEKAVPKRKAKAKAAAKAKDDKMVTPKKKLFSSESDSDDEAGDDGECPDGKPGDAAKVKEALERCAPEAHKKKKKGGVNSQEAESACKASEKPKGKTAKVNLSPFAKKERARRKKTEKAIMHQGPEEDTMIQALCLQHMRNVENMKYEEVKDYLREKLTNKHAKEFKLDEYWGRTACGVKVPELGDGTARKAPQIAYFKPYGTSPTGWNFGMVLVYVSASLMATRLHQPNLFLDI